MSRHTKYFPTLTHLLDYLGTVRLSHPCAKAIRDAGIRVRGVIPKRAELGKIFDKCVMS